MVSLKLTSSQMSAFECRDWSEAPTVQECWDGRRTLTFADDQRDGLFSEIIDASNAEDAQAEMTEMPNDTRQGCRGAALALGNVASKVLRMTGTIS